MPKMKSRRGAAKRFKKTGSGKVKRSHAFARHLMSSKTRKQKRHLKGGTIVDKTNARAINRLLPY
jgi:large subunit ribosomal protein L35